MAIAETSASIVRLGWTTEHCFLGIPKLFTNEEVRELPLPLFKDLFNWHLSPIYSVERFLNSTDIGFTATAFLAAISNGSGGNYPIVKAESLEGYAHRVAAHLGDYIVDTTFRLVGPGSIIQQCESQSVQLSVA